MMEREVQLSKYVNRGVLTRGWLPHLFNKVKSILLPAFLKNNARKPLTKDRIPFQDGITNTIIGTHVNLTKIIPGEIMQNVPLSIPWKVLEKVGIPSVAELLMHGPAPMASAVEIQQRRVTDGNGALGPSAGTVYDVGMRNNYPDYVDRRNQRYSLSRAVSVQLPPTSGTTGRGRPEVGPEDRARMRQASEELPSTSYHGPLHRRENLPRPTPHHPMTAQLARGSGTGTQNKLASSRNGDTRYSEGTAADGKTETLTQTADSAAVPTTFETNFAIIEIVPSATVSTGAVDSANRAATALQDHITDTQASIHEPTDEAVQESPRITRSVDINGQMDGAEVSTKDGSEGCPETVHVNGSIAATTQLSPMTLATEDDRVPTADACAQAEKLITTSTEIQCGAATTDASIQAASELLTNAVETPKVKMADASVQGASQITKSTETQCEIQRSDASIQATAQPSTRTIATQSIQVEMLEASVQGSPITTRSAEVQHKTQTSDATSQSAGSASTATTGTQTCRVSSSDVGNQVSCWGHRIPVQAAKPTISLGSQCDVQSSYVMTQVFPSTHSTSTQVEDELDQDDGQLAQIISQMVKRQVAKPVRHPEVELESADKMEEEVIWFLSRMRDIFGISQDQSDIIITDARRIADEPASKGTQNNSEMGMDTSSCDILRGLRNTASELRRDVQVTDTASGNVADSLGENSVHQGENVDRSVRDSPDSEIREARKTDIQGDITVCIDTADSQSAECGLLSPKPTNGDSFEKDSLIIEIDLGTFNQIPKLQYSEKMTSLQAVTKTKSETFNTLNLSPGPGLLRRESFSVEASGTAATAGILGPATLEMGEDGPKGIVKVPSVEYEDGWILPDVEVPIVDDDRIEFRLENDGVTRMVLGSGTFGSVAAARYTTSDGTIVDVAVKIYNNQSKHTNIIREAKLLQYLQDTGVFPRFYGFVDLGVGDETNICLVQELFGKGTTLTDLIAARINYLEPKEWMSICIQLAKGLRKIHERLVIYNDLKENNVLVDESVYGRPVLKFIDVGISTYKYGVSYNYTTEQMANYSHVAPEVQNHSPTSVLSDIYGLGRLYLKMNEITTIPGLMDLAEACTKPDPKERICLDGITSCLVAIARSEKLF